MSAKTPPLEYERRNIDQTLRKVERALQRKRLNPLEVAGLGTYLHNVYSGIERILRYQLSQRGIQSPKTETWHKDLMQKARAAKLLDQAHYEGLRELLLFRHAYVHGYAHLFNEARLRELALPALTVCRALLDQLR